MKADQIRPWNSFFVLFVGVDIFPQFHETSCGFQNTSEASFRKHDSIVLQMFDLTDLWSLLIAYHEDFWLRPRPAVFLASWESSSPQLHVDLQTLG